jgi:hypothetical protein
MAFWPLAQGWSEARGQPWVRCQFEHHRNAVVATDVGKPPSHCASGGDQFVSCGIGRGNSHAEPRRSPRGSCCRTQAFRPVPYANGVLASSPGLVRGTRTTLGLMPIRTSTATRLWPRMGAGVASEALKVATCRSHALRGISPSRLGGFAFAVGVGTERGEKPQSREAAKGLGRNSVCRPV